MDAPHVIHESPSYAVIEKPAGLIVHTYRTVEKEAPKETLVDWVLMNIPEVKGVGDKPEERPGIVHRLDRETSGLLIIPKSQESFLYFKSLFQKGEIHKTYLAVVDGIIKEKRGTISLPIGIKNGTTKRTVRGGRMVKEAKTDYEVIREGEREGKSFSVLKVFPKTGRTHQIRVHLTAIGHPILGDTLYGKRIDRAPRLMLHALMLDFKSPEGEVMHIEGKIPSEFKEFQLST
jgi:23S rRNA pseudouridine1911/1915/1917 synthase